MELPSRYVLDRESIKLNAYRLICHFYSNKEIARQSEPGIPSNGIARLEQRYFYREVSHLLLNIAMSLRVLDDLMKGMEASSELKKAHYKAMDNVNQRYLCMMFDDMNLRQVCNKIIHADIMEPHLMESKDGTHLNDSFNWLAWAESNEGNYDKEIPKPDPIEWRHLTNNVRLVGKYNNKEWCHVLVVPVYVEAVSELLA